MSIKWCGLVQWIESHRNTIFSEPIEEIIGNGNGLPDIERLLIYLESLKFMSQAVYFCLECGDGLSGTFHRCHCLGHRGRRERVQGRLPETASNIGAFDVIADVALNQSTLAPKQLQNVLEVGVPEGHFQGVGAR